MRGRNAMTLIIISSMMKWLCKGCFESEEIGLLKINSSTIQSYLNPWQGGDCCDWERVECDSTTGHVIGLNLNFIRDENGGNWYLNASLFLPFRQLNRLELSGNNIAGCVVNEGFERLSTLTNLEILDLTSNGFNNSILHSLSALPSLKSLDLGFNKLNGFIDMAALNNLTSNLQDLHLSENQIEGFQTVEGGEAFPTFNKLEYLDLSYNQLNKTADLIKTISTSNKLEYLDLRCNQLNKTTDLIQTIGRLKSLAYLKLSGNKASGNIKGLRDLTHLEYLDLRDNNMSGDFPRCFANMTSLRYLDISYNQFTGNISLSPWQSLASLNYIDLSSNHFRIPLSLTPFFNLSKLQTLDLDGNTFYSEIEDPNLNPTFQLTYLFLNGYGDGGSIPKFLYPQHDLQYLYISGLKLRGGFPHWILQNNTKLEVLYFPNNSLSGAIQLHNVTFFNLTFLDISDNLFIGNIPLHIGGVFPRLQILGMSRNELEGIIPDSLCNCDDLYFLDISQNMISGTVPKCIWNMHSLSIMDLSKNNVSGTLPLNFGPSILEVVNLSKNKFQGSLGGVIFSCTNLVVLDLSHNNFSGSVPLRIGELSQLSFIFLGYNNLGGRIPAEICELKQLIFLDLSHNRISGHMRPCMMNITRTWSGNQSVYPVSDPLEITMKGRTYLYAENILKYVSGMDLSCNNLTGQIPSEIGNLRNAKALNLSGNDLTGPIPPSFSNLREIESLDLSCNNLQGPIPRQLTALTSLEVFDVSFNNLSGQTLGQVAQFATFSESSYKGNPFLCGWPLSRSCGPPKSPPSSTINSPLDGTSDDEFIDMECFYVSFGVAYAMVLLTLVAILCINPYWRRVWFYYVKTSIDNTYYFIIDNVFPLFFYR